MKILVTHPKHWAGVHGDVEVRHVSIGGNTPKRLDDSVSYDGIGEVATRAGKEELIMVAEEWKPDVFLFGIHFELDTSTINLVDSVSGMTCMHYTDQREGAPDEVLKYAGFIDLLLVTNQDKDDHDKYNSVALVETLYDGVDLDEYWHMPISPRSECVFGGNNFWALWQTLDEKQRARWPQLDFPNSKLRNDLLLAVNSQFDLTVYGNYGWDERVFNVKKPLYHPEYIKALRSGHVILGTAVAPRRKLYMRRTFRSLASGFLVTEYVPGMEEDFTNHEHLVWYRDVEEALDLISYYLAHDDKRKRIARQARKLVAEKHTHMHRLNEFVEIVRRHL